METYGVGRRGNVTLGCRLGLLCVREVLHGWSMAVPVHSSMYFDANVKSVHLGMRKMVHLPEAGVTRRKIFISPCYVLFACLLQCSRHAKSNKPQRIVFVQEGISPCTKTIQTTTLASLRHHIRVPVLALGCYRCARVRREHKCTMS